MQNPLTIRPLNSNLLNDIRLWFHTNEVSSAALNFLCGSILHESLYLTTDVETDQDLMSLMYDINFKSLLKEAILWKVLYGWIPFILKITDEGKIQVKILNSSINGSIWASGLLQQQQQDNVSRDVPFADNFMFTNNYFVLPENYQQGIFDSDLMFQFYSTERKGLVRSFSNYSSDAFKTLNTNVVGPNEWLHLYIFKNMVPEYRNPIPKTPFTDIYFELQKINSLIMIEEKIFANNGFSKIFYEPLKLSDPDHERVLEAQLEDINENIQSIRQRDGWENDNDLQTRVRMLEAMKRVEKNQSYYDSSKPGRQQTVSVSEASFHKIYQVPTGFRLANVLPTPETTPILQVLYQRKDALNPKIQKAVTGLDISAFQGSGKGGGGEGGGRSKMAAIEMKKFESVLDGVRRDFEDFMQYIHSLVTGMLTKAGYEDANSLLKDLNPNAVDEERRSLLKANYEAFLNAEFLFKPVAFDMFLDAKELASMTKAGILTSDQARDIVLNP